jgi:hypothetical protein
MLPLLGSHPHLMRGTPQFRFSFIGPPLNLVLQVFDLASQQKSVVFSQSLDRPRERLWLCAISHANTRNGSIIGRASPASSAAAR